VDVVVVVDVANVVGSVPDGWWRDRVGATTRLLARLVPLAGSRVQVGGMEAVVVRVVAVVEGQAKAVADVPGVDVVRAARDGDTSIVEVTEELVQNRGGDGRVIVVVTADRGLRARLPDDAVPVGPRWLDDAAVREG
jgi:hypothetical protein